MIEPFIDRDPIWPFVRTTVIYDVVDSTSDRAAELVRTGDLSLPLAVWARTQTNGRGRGLHEWWSDPGSLTFTIAIDPSAHGLTVENESTLALATAVAIIDALGALELGDSSVGIRWPNDLEAHGRKLGGILPERVETDRGPRVLIGIGLNVRTNLAMAPADVRAMATSIAELGSAQVDLDCSTRLIPAILGHFALVLERMASGDASLPAQWDRLDLLRDSWVRVDQGGRIVAGRGEGIDAQGALRLNDGRETLHIFGGRVIRSA